MENQNKASYLPPIASSTTATFGLQDLKEAITARWTKRITGAFILATALNYASGYFGGPYAQVCTIDPDTPTLHIPIFNEQKCFPSFEPKQK